METRLGFNKFLLTLNHLDQGSTHRLVRVGVTIFLPERTKVRTKAKSRISFKQINKQQFQMLSALIIKDILI